MTPKQKSMSAGLKSAVNNFKDEFSAVEFRPHDLSKKNDRHLFVSKTPDDRQKYLSKG